jgi:hypothetical protein
VSVVGDVASCIDGTELRQNSIRRADLLQFQRASSLELAVRWIPPVLAVQRQKLV